MAERSVTTASSFDHLGVFEVLSRIRSDALTSFSAYSTQAEGFPTAQLVLRQRQIRVFVTEFYFSHGPHKGVEVYIGRQESEDDAQVMSNIAQFLKLSVPDEIGITEDMILQMVQACGLPQCGRMPTFARYETQQGVWTRLTSGTLQSDIYA